MHERIHEYKGISLTMMLDDIDGGVCEAEDGAEGVGESQAVESIRRGADASDEGSVHIERHHCSLLRRLRVLFGHLSVTQPQVKKVKRNVLVFRGKS